MEMQKVKNSKVRGSPHRNRQNRVHANIPYVQSENSNKLLTSKLKEFIEFDNEVYVTDES